MARQRRDRRGRILRTGESQRKDGRYVYQWTDARGKRNTAYSWKLTSSDRMPTGKKAEPSLREIEKEIQRNTQKGIDIDYTLTLGDLIDIYMEEINMVVSYNTYRGYESCVNHIRKFGWDREKVSSVSTAAAKRMVLQAVKDGLSVFTVQKIKSFLKSVYNIAIENEYVSKNPFSYKWTPRVDTAKKKALTVDEQKSLLLFIESNPTLYKKYYHKVIFLLNTGLRVSEFCGVTIDDIDFHRSVLIVDKQLSITHHNEYYISRPKSQSGNRVIPLNDMALEAAQWFLDHRDTKGKDFSVDGYSDFLLLNNRGRGMNCSLLNDQFNVLTRRYNQEHKSPIKVTPHILRHTFCSNCIRSGMTPKAVQVLMGHSSFDLTMNVYTHITDQEVADQFFSVCSNIAVKP